MRHILTSLLVCSAVLAFAQADTSKQAAPPPKPFKPYNSNYELPDPKPYAATIRAEDLKVILTKLTSKELQGRETGEPGQRLAADFIAQQFKEAGLPPVGDIPYKQKVKLVRDSWKDISLKVGDQEFKNRQDYYVFPSYTTDAPVSNFKEVIFVGYGIDDPAYSDYGKADVEGKAVLVYDGEPMSADGKYLISKGETRSNWSLDWRKKVMAAKKRGAAAVFLVDSRFSENLKANRKNISTYGWKPTEDNGDAASKGMVNHVFISAAVADAIIGKKAEKTAEAITDMKTEGKFKPVKLKTKVELHLDKETQTLEGSNVIGFIEGSDPDKKKEYVIITAHYDHLGMSDSTVIYHGADDNASGTSAVIEIARAFAEAKKKGVGPARSVVCMLVSGEEKGLLGSNFYVNFPLFNLKQTVVDINIDMVGRLDDEHLTKPDYVYVIGSDRLSTELHEINEKANKTYMNLDLDYKYNDKNDPNHYYERSDHYNFAERGIPAIFYFNGTHADYHKTTDTEEKINYDALVKRAQLAFYTAWDIANRPIRISANLAQPPKE
jgi:hypothetical protein